MKWIGHLLFTLLLFFGSGQAHAGAKIPVTGKIKRIALKTVYLVDAKGQILQVPIGAIKKEQLKVGQKVEVLLDLADFRKIHDKSQK